MFVGHSYIVWCSKAGKSLILFEVIQKNVKNGIHADFSLTLKIYLFLCLFLCSRLLEEQQCNKHWTSAPTCFGVERIPAST